MTGPLGGEEKPTAAGLDGCRGGWVVAADQARGVRLRLIAESQLAALIRDWSGCAMAVDMPVGLLDRGPRRADVAARRRLGPRWSSVFPAPIRAMLDAATWEEAGAAGRAAGGGGCTRQTFGILSKVRDLDRLLTPAHQDRVVEAHPEVSFAAMKGAPLCHPKVTVDGRRERLELLATNVGPVDALLAGLPKGVRGDGVDALAMLWTARRLREGRELRLPDGVEERDARGLRCQIVV